MAAKQATQVSGLPTNAQANKFNMLSPMMDSMLTEMRELSKKKQDGIVNDLKVKMINRVLKEVKEILSSDPSSQYLDLLDEESLPQNSDAVLILGQFRAAMDQFKSKYFRQDRSNSIMKRWYTQENP
jgi:hypothetical protein